MLSFFFVCLTILGRFSSPQPVDIGIGKEANSSQLLGKACITMSGGVGALMGLTSCPPFLEHFDATPSDGPIVCCPVPPTDDDEASSSAARAIEGSTHLNTVNPSTPELEEEDAEEEEEEDDLPLPELPDPLVKEEATVQLNSRPVND